tara:strand:- start:374 stop:1258 length:885 start_codon:yes stop_codon:yes gene_type:complete
MKKYISIAFIFLSVFCFAKDKTKSTGQKKFDLGLQYYQEGKLDSALVQWKGVLDEKSNVEPNIYGCAFFNIPTIYWQLKDYDKAKEWFKKVLSSDVKDNDETGSIMEPHTNYKHKSAMALVSLSQIDSNYTEALHWLNQADTLYRYWGFEGSATNISEKQSYLLQNKTDLLLKLDSNNVAIRAIIIELICSRRLESFFGVSEHELFSLIKRDSFITDFENAINALTITNKDKHNFIASFKLNDLVYQIPISNKYPEGDIPHYWKTYFIDKKSEPNKDELILYIKNRSFYKHLKK